VYFATFATLAGCAYGVTPEQEIPHDGGIIKIDGGGIKDAKAPIQDAGVVETSTDLPDVSQPFCSSLPLATGEPSCDSCVSSSCCNEDQACGFDQDCIGFIDCMNQCFPLDGGPPDTTCESSCETTYPGGANELGTLDTCMQDSCSSTCF
jgi:hypothetical protein